jgi:putative nucleotidyltransferase with HDIG domain
VCAAGVLCGAPALRPGTHWPTLAVLAGLYALCEPGVLPARITGRHPPSAVGPFLPVLLAGSLLLPPAAAALVAVPGSLAGHPVPWVRRCWRAAHLAVAAWAAALCCQAVGGSGEMRAAGLPYGLLPAGCAALCFWVTATALTGAVLITAEHQRPAAAWGTPLLTSLAPYLTYGVVALMTALLWLRGYGAFAAVLVPLPMYVACWFFARARRARAAHRATVRALVHAVDLKDSYTRGHSERVGRASAMIARELGMPEARVDSLRLAGLLHDIGKLGVPTRILRKNGPLTAEERAAIQLHPEYGHDMTRGIAFLGEAREAILHHHERLDGTGYPHGLSGDRIPEFARAVAVADAFDAMTSTRSYRPPRPVAEAVEELRRCAGTHFDPAMVAALVRALASEGWPRPTDVDSAAPDESAVPAARAGSAVTAAKAGAAAPPAASAASAAPAAKSAPTRPAAPAARSAPTRPPAPPAYAGRGHVIGAAPVVTLAAGLGATVGGVGREHPRPTPGGLEPVGAARERDPESAGQDSEPAAGERDSALTAERPEPSGAAAPPDPEPSAGGQAAAGTADGPEPVDAAPERDPALSADGPEPPDASASRGAEPTAGEPEAASAASAGATVVGEGTWLLG